MTDQAPVSTVQSIAAPNQDAPYPVLEPKKVKAPPFTRETARIAALKSWEARRKAKEPIPQPIPQRPALPDVLPEVSPRLELIREQINLTRAVLNDTRTGFCPKCERSGMEPHHRAALLRALDSLLDRERILLGIPGPGTLKPMSQSRRRAAPSDLAPLPISPTDGQ